MPLVTGTLTDFITNPLAAGINPRIVFQPSGAAAKNGRLFASRPIIVAPQPSGYFEADLFSNEGTTPPTWYLVKIQWLDSDGGYVAADNLEWKLRVPADGGQIGALLEAPSPTGAVWFGPTPPPVPSQYTGWINPEENPPIYRQYE
jgi:hypothetical protein